MLDLEKIGEKYLGRSKQLWKYLGTTLLIPLFVFYMIEMLQDLLFLGQSFVALYMIVMSAGTFIGCALAMYGMTGRSEGVEGFMKVRLVKLIPTITWGYQMVQWALSDVEPKEYLSE